MILNKLEKIFLLLPTILLPVFSVQAQWVSNPAVNTKLVNGPKDPINITALDDRNGGLFVFWEDKKIGNVSDIFFIHTNENGEVSFRADGKTVSTLTGRKEILVAVTDDDGNAYVLWKSAVKDKPDQLFIQKLSKNGERLWQSEGKNISENELEVLDYSIDINRNGIICVSYLMREPGFIGDYLVEYQFLDQSGSLLYKNSDKSWLFKSNSRKSKTSVVADYEGGAFVFWLENFSGKSVLRGSYVDENDIKKWGKEPVNISSTINNVLSYTVNRFGNSVYLSFQYQGQKKEIHHQLITRNGNLPWGTGGKRVTSLNGNQLNSQTALIDSSIYVTWTNEFQNDKNLFIQKFDKNGKPLWKKDGISVIDLKGDQFGQKIINDEKGNLIVAWIDRRVDSVYGNIYVQKIDTQGKLMWDSLSVVLGSFHNSQKSYLNLVPDGSGGAIAVFKEKREGKNEIYAQKIFNTGTYASQVLGFSANIDDGKIRLSWYAANESPEVFYNIERTVQSDTGFANWSLIGTVEANEIRSVNFYELFDVPNTYGTLYYRVVQKDGNAASTVYDLVKINYLESASSIVLAQNLPNPFTDSTTISFYLPEEENVILEFFDSKVELIKEIPKQKYSAGRHEIIFRDENLIPGIYFYRFKAGNYIEVRKMVVSPK